MNIYLAAPWKRKLDAQLAADALEAAGHTITSRWLDYYGDTDDPEELAAEAINDIEDIDAADVFVLLNLEPSEGKAVETGLALAEGLQILGVGQPSNVFHHLPEIQWVSTLAEAIDVLAGRTDDAA
jgi:nucleoside 2-deoxyribosyltransferase